MKTLSLTEVKAKLSELIDEVESRDERIVITRRGRPAAVLVSQDDLDSWQETLEIDPDRALMAEIRRGIRQIRRGQTVTYEKVFGPARYLSGRTPKPSRRAASRMRLSNETSSAPRV